MKTLKINYDTRLNDIEIKDAASFFERNQVFEYVDMLNWPTQFPYKPSCQFKIARSNTSIFIHFKVIEKSIRALYSNDHEPVWEDSCVEFFCQLPGQKHYLNFEFNCIGTCLATKRLSRTDEIVPLPSEKMNLIKRYSSLGIKPFEEKKGNFEWKLTVEIPFSLIGIQIDELPTVIKANFYKCGDETSVPHYLSWNNIITKEPDFHQPEFFGELIF
jgi:hypothetical protein